MTQAPRPFGVVTTQEAIADGWTCPKLSEAVTSGTMLRLTAGAYVSVGRWKSLSAQDRHVARALARLVTRGDTWAAARRTAAALQGFDLLGELPLRPQLVRPWTGTERASSRFERVATLPESQVRTVHGFRVTAAARTVVDLAREETFRSAVVTTDSALRGGLTPEELEHVLAFCSRWPGAKRAMAVLAFADGRAETALESVSRVAVRTCGLPDFEPQVEVRVGDRLVARVDGLWREWNLVGEADGKSKYGSPEDVYAEKRRQDELEDLGLTVVRWGWDEAWRPVGLLDGLILRGRERALRKELDPRVRLVRTTLEDAWARSARARRAA